VRVKRRRAVLAIVGAAALVVLFATIAQFGRSQAGPVRFTDIATSEMAEPKADSPGACFGDVDGDGDEDLFVANSGLMQRSETSRLWLNDGRGRFVDGAQRAGITSGLQRKFISCSLIDIDNDGDLDLFVASKGTKRDLAEGNKLFENKGDGTFTDRTSGSGVALIGKGGNSSDWADFDNDGDVDGFLANRSTEILNSFFEQVRPFVFRDIGPQKGLADPAGPETTFLGSWFDYDADGDPDLLMALDWWGAELFRNDAGRFTRVTTSALPPATDDTPGAPPNNAMGVGWGDYDNDGCIDAFITGMNIPGVGGFEARVLTDLASRLYRNNCNGTFTDVTQQSGFGVTGLTEWSANFIDFDNDGDLDLSVVAGNAGERIPANEQGRLRGTARKGVTVIVTAIRKMVPMSWVAWAYRYEMMIPASGSSGPASAMPNLLYQNMLVETGAPTFMNVTDRMGVMSVGAVRASVWADIDNDGDLDWFLPGRGTPNRLFRNNGPTGNHLRAHLIGARIKTALGAWVKIRVGKAIQVRHLRVLDGYLAQSQIDPHFGVGTATRVDEIWVRWPGTTRWILMCTSVPANVKVTIIERNGCRW
jgi:hypothetical protein